MEHAGETTQPGESRADSERLRRLVENPTPAAAAELRQEIARCPEAAHLHAALGMVLSGLGDLDGAVDALDQAHYLRPQSVFILYNYGLALEQAGRPREARRRYEAVLRLNPGHPRVREHLAALAARERAPAPQPVALAEARPREPEPITPSPSAAEPEVLREPAAEAGAEPLTAQAPLGTELPRGEPRSSSPAEPAPAWAAPEVGTAPYPPSRPPVSPDWEPEALPGFLSLGQGVLMLCFQQPLLWLAVPAVPASAAAFLVPKGGGWVGPLLWLAALSLAAGPLVAAMSAQLLHGSPRPEGGSPAAVWLRAVRTTAPALFITVAPFAVLLGVQVPWEGWLVLCVMLALTLPLQALLAPALMRSLLRGVPFGKSLGLAFRGAGARLWMHLALMAAFALGLGLLLAFMAVVAQESTRGLGHAVIRSLEVGAVALVGSFWGALVTLCGLDALASETEAATG